MPTPKQITEEVPQGRNPGPDGKLPTSMAHADPTREYLAAIPSLGLASYLRALPQYIDDLTRDFGSDVYERMAVDPQVGASLEVYKLGVLSQGVHVFPSDTEDKQAVEIAEFCQRALDELPSPLMETLRDLLDAVMMGHRLAEITLAPGEGADRKRLVLAGLRVKPRRTYSFVVDVYNRLAGVLGLVPGQALPPMATDTVIGDLTRLPHFVPSSKFAILTFRSAAADPRGNSLGRQCYTPWWLKQQALGEWLRYMAQFASPTVWGTPPEGAQRVPLLDSAGVPVTGATGVVYVEPTQQLLRVLEQVRNGAALALPAGSRLEALAVGSGQGAPFLDAIKFCNEEISKVILGQTLATGEGQYQARAAASVHQDVMGLMISYLRALTEHILRRHILRLLVRVNFGANAIAKTPKVSLAESEQQDFAQDGATIASLFKAGFFDPAQLPELDASLNLPPRPAGSVPPGLAQPQAGPGEAPAGPQGDEDAGEDPSGQPDGSGPQGAPQAQFWAGDEASWRRVGEALRASFAASPGFARRMRDDSRGMVLPPPIRALLR